MKRGGIKKDLERTRRSELMGHNQQKKRALRSWKFTPQRP
jgi:hypothetical protein